MRVAFRAGTFAVAGQQDLVGAIHLQRIRDTGAPNHLRGDR